MKLLGDRVEAGLKRVGIKARPGCGCQRRKAVLNRLDRNVRATVRYIRHR